MASMAKRKMVKRISKRRRRNGEPWCIADNVCSYIC
jgi:hypothetical protein